MSATPTTSAAFSKRGRFRRRRRPAEPRLRRSAVPQGDSHVDGSDASRAVCHRAVPDLWTPALTRVRAAGFQLVALTLREDAVTLEEFAGMPRTGQIALLVGAEGPGLQKESEALADVRVGSRSRRLLTRSTWPSPPASRLRLRKPQ
jgi:hypothetical protein